MRLRFYLFFLFALSAVALVALAAACSSSSGVYIYYPTRGIQVRADSITQGKGCGTGPTQVYKYVAVVSDAEGKVRAASLNECFADAVFQELGGSADGGFFNFYVDVYAFNAADFAKPQRGSADAGGSTVADVVAEIAPTDGAPSHADDRHWAGRTLKFTWETDCTAVEEQGVEVIAVCKRLRNPGYDGTVRLLTGSFPGGFGCGDDKKDPPPTKGFTQVRASIRGIAPPPPPPTDGGTDDAGTDAGDASDGAADASAEAGSTPDASPLPPVAGLEGACPAPLTFQYLPAPADLTIDVELVGPPSKAEDGGALDDAGPDAGILPDGGALVSKGRAVCRATTKLYESVDATCAPAP